MSKLVSITQAAELTGISVTSLRRGVASGRLPALRANSQAGKLLFDPNLLMQVLRQEACNNIRSCNMGDDTQEPVEASNTSCLAGLFKQSEDTDAERDILFGYERRNTTIAGSLSITLGMGSNLDTPNNTVGSFGKHGFKFRKVMILRILRN